jgi:hypothetical protein
MGKFDFSYFWSFIDDGNNRRFARNCCLEAVDEVSNWDGCDDGIVSADFRGKLKGD